MSTEAMCAVRARAARPITFYERHRNIGIDMALINWHPMCAEPVATSLKQNKILRVTILGWQPSTSSVNHESKKCN